jgi:hypothetical protein
MLRQARNQGNQDERVSTLKADPTGTRDSADEESRERTPVDRQTADLTFSQL